MNFVPTRPIEDITREFVDAFWTIYDPERYLDRTYQCALKLGASPCKVPFKLPTFLDLKALGIVIWRQGVQRSNRAQFWHHLFGIFRHNRPVFIDYLMMCAHFEHFLFYREIVKNEIEAQLADFLSRQKEQSMAMS